MDRYRYNINNKTEDDFKGGGDAAGAGAAAGGGGVVYEAQGESDHQIGIIPRERQKTASELSEDSDSSGGFYKRKRSYSFGNSSGGKGDGAAAEMMMEIRNLEEKVQELYNKISLLQSDLEGSQDMYFSMMMEKSKETEKYNHHLKSLQEKIKQLEETLDEAQTASGAAETRRKKVEERLLEVKRDNQQLVEEKQEYEKEIKILSGEVEECRRQLVQKEDEIECIRENSSSYLDAWISNEKRELEDRIFGLIEANKELKTENKNLLEEMSSRNVEPIIQRVSEEVKPVNTVSTESQTDLLIFKEDINTDDKPTISTESQTDLLIFQKDINTDDKPGVVDTAINDDAASGSDESFKSLVVIDNDRVNFSSSLDDLDESFSAASTSSTCRTSCSSLSVSSTSASNSPLAQESPLPRAPPVMSNYLPPRDSVVDELPQRDPVLPNVDDLPPKDSVPKTLENELPASKIRKRPLWKGAEFVLSYGPVRQAFFIVFLFILAFVSFEIVYGILWHFRPLKIALDASAAAAQYGRLEHPVPPVI